MNNKQKLQKTLKRVFDKQQPTTQEIPGRLGTIRNGKQQVKVSRRKGFVYVRLHGNQSEVVQAFNDKVSVLYDMPVVVSKVKGRGQVYRVIGKDVALYENWGGNYGWAQLAPHGNQHSFGIGAGGSDVVWVFKKQFMPLLVHPNSGTSVKVEPDWYQWGNTYTHFTGASVDLAGAVPHMPGDARFVTLYLDGDTNQLCGATGTLFLVSPFPNDVTSHITQIIPNQGIPLSAVLLTFDTVNIAWNNLYDDIRPIFGGNAMSSLAISSQGVPKSTGTSTIDFGDWLSVTASGTTAFVNSLITTGTSTYLRVGVPTALSGLTGLYWKVPGDVYASGTLFVFTNGVAQTPGVYFSEQHPSSGTYQLSDAPPTGSVFAVIWGSPSISVHKVNATYLSSYTATGSFYIPKSPSQDRVQFNYKVTDDENAVSIGSDWKFTAPRGGIYHVHACLGGQLVDELFLLGYKNGVKIRDFQSAKAAGNWKQLSADWILRMNPNDTLYFNCNYNGVSGSWVSGWTWIDISYSEAV